MIKRSALLVPLLLTALSGAAIAQSSPNFTTGQVPTAAQWNSYFSGKADVGTLMDATGSITGSLAIKAPRSPVDLITAVPLEGLYAAGVASPYQAEPILGPFLGLDFTRAQSVRWLTTAGGSNQGEYGTLLNMHAVSGFPSAWAAGTAYLAHDSVLNGSNLYNVVTPGTSASSGGPTGTGASITDGTVVWAYSAVFSPQNGGKTNLGVFTYQDSNSSAAWTAAFDHQIASGGSKKAATTLELDMNNYWGDYTTGPSGPAAVALSIFAGGTRRSSAAIAIGQYGAPTDPTALTNAITMCCATLASNASVYDLTASANGFYSQGTHSGSSFTDGSTSGIGFNAYGTYSLYAVRAGGTAPIGIRFDGTYSTATTSDVSSSANGYFDQGTHSGSAFTDGGSSGIGFNAYGAYSVESIRAGGTAPIGLRLDGTYSTNQVQGAGWNVTPTGGGSFLSLAASAGATVTGGLTTDTMKIGSNAGGTQSVNINGAAGSYRTFGIQTGGANRWFWGADAATESGSNAGSNFYIQPATDAGAPGPLAVTINRATSAIGLNGATTVTGGLTTDTAKVAVTTVAGLGTCNAGAEGTHRAVSDATAPAFLGTLTGGGAVHSPAYCNGTAWVAG